MGLHRQVMDTIKTSQPPSSETVTNAVISCYAELLRHNLLTPIPISKRTPVTFTSITF